MPTTLTNGIQLPDKGSVDWYSSMQSNYNLIDTHLGDTDVHVTAEDKANWNSKQGSLSQAQLDAIAQVATNTDDIATLQSGKADASHTHSSSDITDIDDYATKQYVDNSISGLVDNAPDALNTLNELSAALNDDSNFASTVTTALAAKADSADLATVATSGSYTDLTDKPTINDSTITIQKNGSTVDTFTTNGSNKTINIPVPTKTSDLTNDSDFVVSSSLAAVATSGFYNDLDNKPYIPDKISDLIDDSNFVDTSNPAVSSGITSAKVTDYDTHIADTDIHVTTADKNKWNNQTYVFRYSSTALTASSTNSNALLDNTNNLKVGDKVIDSSGVLFSITAIDTANSTFTIGTALIDLAQDSDVVHLSGNETISGDKVFNDRLIKNIDVVLGTAPSTGKYSRIEIADNNKNTLFQILSGIYDTGNSYARFLVQNKTADDGTGLSPTGTIRSCGFIINMPASSTLEGQGSITPRGNQTTDFGLSSYQWRNLWCKQLYLNGTQLDPSAFVTTDTDQTISGNKIFSSNVNVYNSDATATTPNLYLRSSKIEISSQGNTSGGQDLTYLDKNNTTYAYVKGAVQSNGSVVKIRTIAKDSSDNSVINELQILANTNGNKAIFPSYSNETDLGVSSYKWKSVYATNYYYGANNVEFSDKFVTTDTAQTISETKTFTNTIKSKKEVEFTGNRLAYILPEFSASYSGLSLCTYSSNGAVKIGSWKVDDNDNTKHVLNDSLGFLNVTTGSSNSVNIVYLTPKNASKAKLGDSVNKWHEINGVEPSSLSLPSGSGIIDISSYITDLTGVNINNYTPPANGYIVITCKSTDVDYIKMSNNLDFVSLIDNTNNQFTSGILGVWQPCVAGLGIQIRIKSSALRNARFIPCQGNV